MPGEPEYRLQAQQQLGVRMQLLLAHADRLSGGQSSNRARQ
jgi:hypothetical protein